MPTSPRRSGRTTTRATARAAVVAGSVLMTAGALAACSAGSEAETVQIYTPSSGVDLREGDIDVLGALVVADGAGNATLVAGMVSSSPDAEDVLTGIEVADADANAFTTTVVGGSVPIPAGELVQTAEGALVTISGAGLTPGRLLDVTFAFERSGAVSGQLPVVPRTGPYAEVATSPTATGGTATSPTATGSTPTDPG